MEVRHAAERQGEAPTEMDAQEPARDDEEDRARWIRGAEPAHVLDEPSLESPHHRA